MLRLFFGQGGGVGVVTLVWPLEHSIPLSINNPRNEHEKYSLCSSIQLHFCHRTNQKKDSNGKKRECKLGGSDSKASAYNVGDLVRSLGWENPLDKKMATHSSSLAWKIPWTEEPGRLQSMVSQRVGHDWATSLHFKQYLLSTAQTTGIMLVLDISILSNVHTTLTQ